LNGQRKEQYLDKADTKNIGFVVDGDYYPLRLSKTPDPKLALWCRISEPIFDG
jgi:hypothetical protein